jgi:hypothetical protein
LQDIIFEVVGDEGRKPIGIFKEKFTEEMNFLTLFLGNPCDDDITKRLSYQKIVHEKWYTHIKKEKNQK